MKKRLLLALVCLVWIALIGAGLGALYTYEATPGTSDSVARHWPSASMVMRGDRPYQLVMVAHPHCPCTRASLGELERVLAQTESRLDVHLLVTWPKDLPPEWLETDLLKKARRIQDVDIVIDEDGRQAKMFGGTTSGQTFLFNRAGELLFAGGITASRGHAGDNLGRAAIVSLVRNGNSDVTQTPFFGCRLHDSQEKKRDGDAWRL